MDRVGRGGEIYDRRWESGCRRRGGSRFIGTGGVREIEGRVKSLSDDKG